MEYSNRIEKENISRTIEENIQCLNEIFEQMEMGCFSIFAGAGLSISSGYVDWKKLLEPICRLMRLDNSGDLTEIAQFYKDKYGRQGLNNILFKEFSKIPKNNDNVQILAKLPISDYWTTNYDDVIEVELKRRGKVVHKIEFQDSFKYHNPQSDVTLYKMHGDREHPDNIVLTKEDYQEYDKKRGLFTRLLAVELVRKSFLFIGFSFNDPNLERILSMAKNSVDSSIISKHYCFMRRVQPYDYLDKNYKISDINFEKYIKDESYQSLKIESLKRNYNIHTILVDDFEQITFMLQYLYDKHAMNNIFISGGINPNNLTDYGKFNVSNNEDREMNRAQSFLTLLGKRLVENNYVIYTGFGAGVGNYVLSGVLSEQNITIQKADDTNQKIHICSMINLSEEQKNIIREQFIEQCGSTIIVFGYSTEQNGQGGVYKEYLCSKKNNNFIIPVPATGYAAEYIYKEMEKTLSRHSEYEILKDNKADVEMIVDNIIELLNYNRQKRENRLSAKLFNSISTYGVNVFISYYYDKDNEIAKQIYNIVNQDCFNQFTVIREDYKKDGESEIKRWVDDQLERAKITILLISNETLNRKYVSYELKKSIENRNVIIPILIDRSNNNYTSEQIKQIRAALKMLGIDKSIAIKKWYADNGNENIVTWLYEAYL